MRTGLIYLLIASLFGFALASQPQKSVIVSYPEDTPDSVLDDAKAAIKQAGGMITHEYKLIKAFAAKTPDKALETVQSQGSKYNAVIEDDQQVHAYGNGF